MHARDHKLLFALACMLVLACRGADRSMEEADEGPAVTHEDFTGHWQRSMDRATIVFTQRGSYLSGTLNTSHFSHDFDCKVVEYIAKCQVQRMGRDGCVTVLQAYYVMKPANTWIESHITSTDGKCDLAAD